MSLNMLVPLLLIPALYGIFTFEKKKGNHVDIALIITSFAVITTSILFLL